MKRIGWWLFGLLFLVIANSAFAEVFCVDTAEEIQAALTTAVSNGQDDEIRIFQGTYVGNFFYATATEVFDLTVAGGFTTQCETQVLEPNNTILDGDQTGRVLTLSAIGLSANLTVKGLTIQNGKTTSDYGGGIYATLGESGTISIDNNNIKNNAVPFYGGGVYVSASSISISNNSIVNNSAASPSYGSYGGGVFAKASSVILENNYIAANIADNDGGGGVYIDSYSGTVSINNNTIENNITYIGGGGILVDSYSANIVLDNNIINSNSAYTGGGVAIGANLGKVVFTNNTIRSNSVSNIYSSYGGGQGGGISVQAYLASFTNNIIVGNTASSYTSSGYTYGGGAYIISLSGIATFINNTIEGNDARNGGGLFLLLDSDDQYASGTLYNNIFWNNTAVDGGDMWIANDTDGDNTQTPVRMFANNFDQTLVTGYFFSLPITIDPSNLTKTDPIFVDPINSDFRLQTHSPMINTGYPTTPDLPDTDINGNPRILGGRVDIGAYEYDDGTRNNLIIILQGDGFGQVTSNPAGIDCGNDCDHSYFPSSKIILSGNPDDGNTFTGWSGGGCTGTSPCTVTMDDNLNVTATFTINTHTIGGTVSGLDGSVVLQNNAGDDLTVSNNGPFTFTTALDYGSSYAVTVLTQPTGHTCTVSDGTGTANANVTNIAVSCSENPPPALTNVQATAGIRSITVTFTTANLSSKFASLLSGSIIFTANCTSNNDGISGSATGPSSPLVVTGVTPGKSYTCTVSATGASGTSTSAPSNVVIPTDDPTSIPTLSEWAQILLALSLIGMAGWYWKRRVS